MWPEKQRDYRSLRYFLPGFGLRLAQRPRWLFPILLWVFVSNYVAEQLARWAVWSFPEDFSLGSYIALIIATKWTLVLLAWFGVPVFIWALARLLTRRFHTFPPCASCRRDDDYRWIRPEMFGWEQGRIFRYHCGGCGDQYLRYGSRFFIVNEDLSIRSYVRSKDGKQWELDSDPQVPAALLDAKRDAWH